VAPIADFASIALACSNAGAAGSTGPSAGTLFSAITTLAGRVSRADEAAFVFTASREFAAATGAAVGIAAAAAAAIGAVATVGATAAAAAGADDPDDPNSARCAATAGAPARVAPPPAPAGPAARAEPAAPPPPVGAGSNASMRSSVIVKPAYSSGARPNSLRPIVAI
jgi:hypothetical protein